jgi:MFS family permease
MVDTASASGDRPASTESVTVDASEVGIRPEVSKAFTVLYTLAVLAGATAINTPLFVTLALRVGEIAPDSKTTVLSILSGFGMVVQSILLPTFGVLSDGTHSRLGRRAPWIIFGLSGLTVGALMIATATSLPMLAIGWIVMTIAAPASVSPLFAVITDRVPAHQQGLLSGFAGSSNMLALVVGSALVALVPGSSFLEVMLPTAVAVVFVGAFLLAFPDRRVLDGQPGNPSVSSLVRNLFTSMRFDPREAPDFAWLLLCIALVALGYGFGATYGVYFVGDHLHVPSEELTSVVAFSSMVSSLPALLFSPLAGWVADKTGRRRPILLVSMVLTAAGLFIIANCHTLGVYYLGGLVGGIGFAMFMGSSFAYVVSVIQNRDDQARDLGLMNVALALPMGIAPFLAPFILATGSNGQNYVALYAVGAVVVLATLPVPFLVRKRG